jgi:sugar phosphate isomerase/epimerase
MDYVDLVAKYGIGGIGGLTSKLLDDEKTAIETAKKVWGLSLKWSIMFTPVDFYAPSVDDSLFDSGIETLKRQCGVAEKIGVQYAYNHVWSSNADRPYEANFDWHVRRLKRVQKVFCDHGIFYGLEFLGPREVLHRFKHEFIHTITGAVALANAAGGKAGFLFDTYHWFCEGARMDDLYYALQHTDRMCGFHLHDGVAGRTPDEQKDLERAMPMTTGVIDSALLYRLFMQYGYTGPVVCEPIQPTSTLVQKWTAEECVKLFSEAYKRVAGL